MLKIEMCGPVLEGLIAARIVNDLVVEDLIDAGCIAEAVEITKQVLSESMPTIVNPRPEPSEDKKNPLDEFQ